LVKSIACGKHRSPSVQVDCALEYLGGRTNQVRYFVSIEVPIDTNSRTHTKANRSNDLRPMLAIRCFTEFASEQLPLPKYRNYLAPSGRAA
jgi:hypothetical protein